MNVTKHVASSFDLATEVTQAFQRRVKVAQERFGESLAKALENNLAAFAETPWEIWPQWYQYSTDFAQRATLFVDALRELARKVIERNTAGLPPVPHFDYETIVDGRKLGRPVNYALVRIIPPAGVSVDPKRRPYIIADPCAGHGRGVGGFKDDSPIAAALQAGHPIYFVIFFLDPHPGQTLLDVFAAHRQFLRKLRELHPDSAKPAIIGNSQGGWVAMMLAVADPEETGPIVIDGAPLSDTAGACLRGTADNPLRASGGTLWGLVSNFESLNPAYCFWDKYYRLFTNVGSERPRPFEFDRWWGGFYLMHREEVDRITRNPLVGDKPWTGGLVKGEKPFDLRAIKAPIILFASTGDGITPPQQAFTWVANVYGSTDEIKARGQVIVGLQHKDVGHLGVLVSGKVANKEDTQFASVLKSIETLSPGLYSMAIHERAGHEGQVEQEIEFAEHRLEDIVAQHNRFRRADERSFEAIVELSEFNERAYELFAQPLIESLCNELEAGARAKLPQQWHPLRAERPSLSDLNPWFAWLDPAAQTADEEDQPVAVDAPARKIESIVSEAISASFDYYRAICDATSEALFLYVYGNVLSLYCTDRHEADAGAADQQAALGRGEST
jgi:pimeloyl-ACP methyl ester carboxylesterase